MLVSKIGIFLVLFTLMLDKKIRYINDMLILLTM